MDVVAVFDSERRFQFVNDAACRFYGRTREQLLRSRLDDLIGTERAEADWASFLEPERVAQGMLAHIWDGEQDGERRGLEVRSHAEFVPGRPLVVLRDITERRRLEDQLRQAQKMEAVGQLAGGVAHDFNNLLTVIRGYSELLRDRAVLTINDRNAIDQIMAASESAASLTKQIVTFSRRRVVAPGALDLNVVV